MIVWYSVISRIKHTYSDDSGASAVEFAIIAPALVLLVVGIIYFGLIFNNYLSLTHAAREGIRHASLHESGALTETAIRNTAALLDQAKLRVTITPYDDRPDGGMVTVKLDYPVQVEVPVIKQILQLSPAWDSGISSLWLTTQATMRIE
ncbi:MAG: pilus assembly protein [Actinobacteria bacterium]|nr:pilus assembly protein [Actinomycetota bacterium]